MRVEIQTALACCAWAAMSACGDAEYRYLAFSDVSEPPIAVELGTDDIVLVEGIATGARVSAIDADGEPMPVLTFESDDTDVFGVERGPALGRWVFFGVSPGEARLGVFSDGHRVARLPVTVEPQPGTSPDAGTP